MLFLFLLLLAFFFNGFCRLLFRILFGVSWLSHFFPPEQSIDVSARKLHGFGAFIYRAPGAKLLWTAGSPWLHTIQIGYHRLSQMANKMKIKIKKLRLVHARSKNFKLKLKKKLILVWYRWITYYYSRFRIWHKS